MLRWIIPFQVLLSLLGTVHKKGELKCAPLLSVFRGPSWRNFVIAAWFKRLPFVIISKLSMLFFLLFFRFTWRAIEMKSLFLKMSCTQHHRNWWTHLTKVKSLTPEMPNSWPKSNLFEYQLVSNNEVLTEDTVVLKYKSNQIILNEIKCLLLRRGENQST